MAAGYTLREIMEYLGHSSLSATERYVKLLPQPAEGSPAERLNAYVARAAEQPRLVSPHQRPVGCSR